jgi:signal transduction histidine kinase
VKLLGHVVRRLGPDPSELVPLAERTGYVEVLRACIGVVVLATVLIRESIATVDADLVVAVTGVYLVVSAIPLLLRRRNVENMLAVAQGMLLADGIYLAWITLVTGGALSPLRFMFFVQVIVVTLLVSYRTGLKLAAWDSLLFLVVFQAHAMGLVAQPKLLSSPKLELPLSTALTVAGLWMTAFATAAFSAVNERELRRQKADLGRLADMTIAIDDADDASGIAEVVLDAIMTAFDFSRGLILSSRGVDLRLVASTEGIEPTELRFGRDELIEEAWRSRRPTLAATLDADSDPCLSELLPNARNVLVVPLMLGEGGRLGIVALEHANGRNGMRRWEISMVVQYAAHGALALHNAWLTEEREEQVDEIQRLQGELVAYNAQLEQTVASRTEKLRDAIADLEKVDEQRRRLLSHVVRAQEDERTRIANDIHDDPLQKLVAAKMQAELLQKTHGDLRELEAIKGAVRSCISSLRLLLFDLRPPILDEEGVGAAVEYVLEQWSTDIGYDVRDELGLAIPEQSRAILFRIAHEALSNARKHAQATHLDVELEAQNDGYLLRVSDNGVGFDPVEIVATKPGHMGLVAMRERAEMAGGRINLYSLPESGTVLEVWMPTEEPEQVTPPVVADAELGDVLRFPLDRSA